jgi:hypothetical protein
MQAPSIVSPKLLDALDKSGFFQLTCTIQAPATTQDQYGQAVHGWYPLPGCQNIPCALDDIASIEKRTNLMTDEDVNCRVLLKGLFPQVTARMRAALSNGLYVDIVGLEFGNASPATMLIGRFFTPEGELGSAD